MKRFLQLVSLVAILIGSSVAQQSNQSPIQAQVVVPRLIRFSGQLPGASGTVGITFTLHKGQQDNAALWIETQNVQLDSAGKYTVLLGVTKPEGIPTDLFSSGEAQWLGVEVQGRTEQPRVLLVSVPYALRAAEADTLAGHAPAEFVTTDKLTSAVQQQMQAASTSTTGNGVHKDSVNRNSVPVDPATNFTDTTTNQVVLVTQHGTGAGLIATAGNNYALSGTSTNTAVYGSSNGSSHATAAAMEGVTTASQGRGIFGWANTTTGVNFGLYGQANSVSGTGIAAVSTATSGTTVGMEIQTNSPAGTAAVVQARGGGKIISGQSGSTNTEKFAVDGSGNVTASGNVSASGDVLASGYVDGYYVAGGYGYFSTGTAEPGWEGLIVYSDTTESGRPTAYLENDDTTDAGDLVFETYNPNWGGQCTIDLAGNLYCTGALSVVANGAEGKKNSLYTMQSPENFLEDFGSVKLVNGVAKVNIDTALKGVISDETSYHVFLTPNGDCEGLYVTNRTATTFEVHELKGGKSNIDVDFRIVAHRAGFEHVRMPDVTKRMAIPANREQQAPHVRPLQTAAVTGDNRN